MSLARTGTGVKLTRSGVIQPTIGAFSGRYIKGGNEIARPEFYREDSCMTSLLLEWDGPRLKAYREKLTHEKLYEMATGMKLMKGEAAGITLTEAEKWLALWMLSGRAIDIAGRLVWSYEPPRRTKKVAGGAVWRVCVHNEHVWLCDRNTEAFDQHYGDGVVKPRIPHSHDISSAMNDHWCRAPKPTGVPLEIVTDVDSLLRLPLTCEQAVTNGEPEVLAEAVWRIGYLEPGTLRLAHGVIESFVIRRGGHEMCVRRAVDVVFETSRHLSVTNSPSPAKWRSKPRWPSWRTASCPRRACRCTRRP